MMKREQMPFENKRSLVETTQFFDPSSQPKLIEQENNCHAKRAEQIEFEILLKTDFI